LADKERIKSLDVLRGLAALSVLLFHYTTHYSELYGRPAGIWFDFPHGYVGVEVFFVISGFVIYMTIRSAPTAFDFVVARFSRLYPAFWACLTLTFVVAAFDSWPNSPNTVVDYLVNLTMFQGFVKVPSVDGAYWSLTYELGFYIAIVGIVFALKIVDRIDGVCLALLLGSLGWPWIMRAIPAPLHFLTIHEYGHLFALGIVLFRMTKIQPRPFQLVFIALAVLAEWLREDVISAAIVAGGAAFVYRAGCGGMRSLCVAPLLWLGAISYPLYLVHQVVGIVILRRLIAAGVPAVLAVVAVALGMIAVASAITLAVERPAQLWIRSRWAARRANGRASHPESVPRFSGASLKVDEGKAPIAMHRHDVGRD
jgi:peptidoglycan/LPS O-acetylase OafA/YrhL